jgi:prepilin-type processing-associated H-X9-DG protein
MVAVGATRGAVDRRAFSTIELLVVLGILALLMGILLPAMISVREQSRSAVCLSNLRQIGHALLMYSHENRGRIIPADFRDPAFKRPPGNWATVLVSGKYLSVPDSTGRDARSSVLRCPSGLDANGFDIGAYDADRFSPLQGGYWERQAGTIADDGSWVPGITVRTWYGINGEYQDGADYPTFRVPSETHRTTLHTLSEIRRPSETAMIYDGFFHHDGQANLMGHARHARRTMTNYLFADGHAAGVRTSDLPASFADADLAARPFPKFKLRQE